MVRKLSANNIDLTVPIRICCATPCFRRSWTKIMRYNSLLFICRIVVLINTSPLTISMWFFHIFFTCREALHQTSALLDKFEFEISIYSYQSHFPLLLDSFLLIRKNWVILFEHILMDPESKSYGDVCGLPECVSFLLTNLQCEQKWEHTQHSIHTRAYAVFWVFTLTLYSSHRLDAKEWSNKYK